MQKRLILTALTALAVGGTALAGDFNYSYVQGSVLGTRVKSAGDSDGGKGFRLEGAISNDQPIFAHLSFARNKYPSSSDNLEFTNASVGVGGHLSLGSDVDLFGIISFENVRIKPFVSYSAPVPPPQQPKDRDASRNGLGFTAGARGHFSDKVEWNAALRFRRIEHIDPIIGVTAGARYLVTPAIAVGVDASYEKYDKDTLDANETIVALGVRYQFGAGK